jgi:hypothetical protein
MLTLASTSATGTINENAATMTAGKLTGSTAGEAVVREDDHDPDAA